MLSSEIRRDNRWPAAFRDLRDAQDDLNRVFTSALRRHAEPTFLGVSIWVGGEGTIVRASVPGVGPDHLNVTVQGQTLILAGQRDPEIAEGTSTRLRAERMHGRFVRTLLLPFRVDPEQVKAQFSLGVLTLELPRPAADRPRRIKIAEDVEEKSE